MEAVREMGPLKTGVLGALLCVAALLLCAIIMVAMALQVDVNGVSCSRPKQWLQVLIPSDIVSLVFVLSFIRKVWKQPPASGAPIVHFKPPAPVTEKDARSTETVAQLLVYDQMVYFHFIFLMFLLMWNMLPADGPDYTGGTLYRIRGCVWMNESLARCRALQWVYIVVWLAFLTAIILVVRNGGSFGCCAPKKPATKQQQQQQPQTNDQPHSPLHVSGRYEQEMESLMHAHGREFTRFSTAV